MLKKIKKRKKEREEKEMKKIKVKMCEDSIRILKTNKRLRIRRRKI